MKKLAFFFIFLLLVLGVCHQIVHSSWMKQKTFSIVQTSLRESGWEVDADTIGSVFPTLDMQGVKIHTPEGELKLGSVKGTLSLWRLLKQEIYFSKATIDQVHFTQNPSPPTASSCTQITNNYLPFKFKVRSLRVNQIELPSGSIVNMQSSLSIKTNSEQKLQVHANGTFEEESIVLHFKGQMVRHADGNWAIEPFKVFTDHFQMKGLGTLDAQGKLLNAHFQIQTDHLHTRTPFAELTYRLLAHVDVKKEGSSLAIHTAWQIPSLDFGPNHIEHIEGLSNALYENNSLVGQGTLSADFSQTKWEACFPFSWKKGEQLTFPEIILSSPLMQGEGNLTWQAGSILSAYASFSIPHIHDLTPDLYGEISGQFSWEIINDTPFLQLDAECSQITCGPAKADKLWLYTQLQDPWNKQNWEITCDIQEGRFHSMNIEGAHLQTSNSQEQWPFQCTLIGTWKHPLALDFTGSWHLKKDEFICSLDHAIGSFFESPLLLLEPSHCLWTSNELVIDPVNLQLSDAKISSHFAQKNHRTDFVFSAKSLPVDFLSLNPLEIMVSGISDVQCSLQGPDDALTGDLSLSVSKMDMLLSGQEAPLSAQGEITAHLKNDQIQIQGSLISKENPILSLDLSLPFHVSVRPFHIKPLYLGSVQGHFFCASRLEEFLDFFDLGTHRIEGYCQCDLALSGTLGNPRLYGDCSFTEGYYQNYFTGTELQNIQARFTAKNDELILTSLSAQDSQYKGSFEAKGLVHLLPQEKFPFQFDVTVSRLNCATFDLLTTEASGHFKIQGDLAEATAKGHLDILESDLTIPSRIPPTLPKLEVVYTHAHAPPAPLPLPPRPTYPLHLDLTVHAPDGIFISGRGIESEWKGDFHVGGTQIDLSTEGNIELLQGTFLFSGRSFALKEGSVKFSGIPDAPPILHLAADIQVQDILITAHLSGPLNNPQITLQSSPPLPLGTIMSYLLFGHDLGEINSSQALRFASAITALAGEGPGILEQTKKSLGIDRIQIITVASPTAEGGETIAVQVGKYVAEGVLVSYSQGAENSSGNINVEVELQNNLSLILESDQAQEQKQGKFTIRWNKTY